MIVILFYFHALARQRRRKKKIDLLDGPTWPIADTKGMLKIASYFDQNLFRAEDKPNILLGPNFWDDQDILTEEENLMLEQSFSEEEI